MDYQVIYYSNSSQKNTKTIAEAIAEALNTTAEQVNPTTKIQRSKLLFIGSGVYLGHVGKKLIKLIGTLPQMEGQKAVIFLTHGGGPKEALQELKTKLEEKGFVITDTWDCLGQWALFSKGHPTMNEIQDAKEFALEMKKKVDISIKQ